MKIEQRELPDFDKLQRYPSVTKAEVDNRYAKFVEKMGEMDLSHIIIYGDREHFANLSYLTGGFDSRFEESLLIVSTHNPPLLITGNEGYSYSDISLLDIKKELFQTFSLQGQTRDKKKLLQKVFAESGIGNKSSIGIIGMKYYEEGEVKDPRRTFDIPHYIVEEILEIVPIDRVENVTSMMTGPAGGLRCKVDEHDIARSESMGNYLSNQMKNVINNLEPGISEAEALSAFRYLGLPFTVHPVVNFGTQRVLMGLASPSFERRLELGDPVSIAFGLEGANIARTGYAVSSEQEFSKSRKDIVEDFFFPYFEALKSWYEGLSIGARAKVIYDTVMKVNRRSNLGISLNPGHQIHMEEWINSPFRNDHEYTLHSGMALQCDIIAFPGEPYVGVHVEDTVILADAKLREDLKSSYPECWNRIERRREFMINTLGISLAEDVLPLSNLPAVLQPYMLKPNYIVTSR